MGTTFTCIYMYHWINSFLDMHNTYDLLSHLPHNIIRTKSIWGQKKMEGLGLIFVQNISNIFIHISLNIPKNLDSYI